MQTQTIRMLEPYICMFQVCVLTPKYVHEPFSLNYFSYWKIIKISTNFTLKSYILTLQRI